MRESSDFNKSRAATSEQFFSARSLIRVHRSNFEWKWLIGVFTWEYSIALGTSACICERSYLRRALRHRLGSLNCRPGMGFKASEASIKLTLLVTSVGEGWWLVSTRCLCCLCPTTATTDIGVLRAARMACLGTLNAVTLWSQIFSDCVFFGVCEAALVS